MKANERELFTCAGASEDGGLDGESLISAKKHPKLHSQHKIHFQNHPTTFNSFKIHP